MVELIRVDGIYTTWLSCVTIQLGQLGEIKCGIKLGIVKVTLKVYPQLLEQFLGNYFVTFDFIVLSNK